MQSQMAPGTFAITRREGRRAKGAKHGFQHDHPGFELTWVGAGTLELDLGGGRIAASDGGCLLVSPEVVTTPWARCTVAVQVMLAPDLLVEAADALPGGRVPMGASTFAAGTRIADLAAVIVREQQYVGADDPGLDALVHGLATSLVRGGEPARERGVAPGIRRALDYLETHHAEALRVDDLARVAELPRFAFLRTFKAQVGESPYQYLIGRRLERAAAQLRSEAQSVLDVALDHGFEDPGRFAKMFARRFGCTPRAWRARFA